MSGSAMSGVIDYFLTGLLTPLRAIEPDLLVQENYSWVVAPTGTTMVVIGGQDPESAVAGDGTRVYMEIGSGRIEEAFVIPCYIDCATGGTDQSVSRKQALAIFDAIVTFVRTDLTFGGLLTHGRTGELQNIKLTGTDDITAEGGRRCVVQFDIACKNFY